jgi:hypothetical protein
MENGEPMVIFHADWRVEQSGILLADGPARIRYDIRRLLCGSDLAPEGPHSFHLTGFYRIDHGETHTLDLGGRHPAGEDHVERVIHLPASARQLELWFEHATLYGTAHYDSDYGRNFTFKVYPALDVSGAVRRYVRELTGAR